MRYFATPLGRRVTAARSRTAFPRGEAVKELAFSSLSLRERVRVREGNSFRLNRLNKRVSLTPTPLPGGEGLNIGLLVPKLQLGNAVVKLQLHEPKRREAGASLSRFPS